MSKFEKVSYSRFMEDFITNKPVFDMVDETIYNVADYCYGTLKLPKRATKGSAGYDFFAPNNIVIKPHQTIKFPTGYRVKLNEGTFLMIVPRSGLGFKYKLTMDNTMGIIDSDYYYSDNEGHIWVKMTNNSDKTLIIEKGEAYAQGIILPFGLTEDDDADGIRNGGFGSTNKGV